MTRPTRALTAALFLLALSVIPVAAHADLEESDPGDGDTIETPYLLTATFSEEFDPDPQRSFMQVVDAAGTEVARGGVSEDDPAGMAVDLPALPPGEYTVRWQTVTAEDNGVEHGTFTFTVAADATSAPTVTAGPSVSTTPQPSAGGSGGDGGPSVAANNDVLLALVIGAIAIGAVLALVFTRMRR